MASIFARIIAGEIPCQKVYEDDQVLAFLDINPVAEGHALIVPKRTVPRLAELKPEEAAALARVLPDLSRRIAAAVGAEGCNVLLNDGEVAGQEVPHVHLHIIPRRQGDGLGYRWKPQKAEPAALEALARRIEEVR